MKRELITEGKTYHNGKGDSHRSISHRLVKKIDLGKSLGHTCFDWEKEKVCVLYEQTAGRYKGKTFVLPLNSFSTWAKGEVKA